jgi:hypothetical protein
MVAVLAGLVSMLCAVLVLMFLKERQADERKRKKFMCATTTEHTLRIHAYDRVGLVYHRCRCGTRVDYADASDWCAICADPKIERQARFAFFRRTA